MFAEVLATKLFIPPPPPEAVRRSRLLALLDAGLHRKLTLVCAPAGFGKTTLISTWLAECGRSAAWLALEEADGDLARFLTYLVAALRTVAPEVGAGAISALQAGPPPPSAAILTPLLNEVAVLPKDFILVLDDYHLVDSAAVDTVLAFLVEHLPPHLHLVIATREDPQLPLPRLRARGHLTEVRAADLRFTPAEAAEFLNQVMDLRLPAADIAALEARTEGWIAGLQLAALSLRGRSDAAAFIRAFTGSHHFIIDYLVEEVLQRQPEPIRSFLIQTSILDRLTGKLCDAVTGEEGGKARLEALLSGNFFLIPLDDGRQWVRYHHLFAEVLRVHLLAEQPALAPVLHRRASVWYEQNGLPGDAIRHALAGEDWGRAAGLIELAIPELRRNRQEAMLLAWLKALPSALIRLRPVLSAHYAGVLLDRGDLEAAEAWLHDVEQWLEPPVGEAERPQTQGSRPPPALVVVDEAEFRRLPGWIAIWRAALALARGDAPGTVAHAQQALDLIPEQENLGRGAATALLGLAAWSSGDLEIAYNAFAEGMARVQKAGFISDVINSSIALAEIRLAQGHLHAAWAAYERGLGLAVQPPAPALRGAADMYVGMSELRCEWGDLQGAMQDLLRSDELGEHLGMPQNPYRRRVAMARIRAAEGDLDGALELLDAAARLYAPSLFPDVRPIGALKARAWLAQGQLRAATSWVRGADLSAHDDLSYRREFEHITLARVLLAEHQHDAADRPLLDASRLLDRLLGAATVGGRTGSAVEILALQALVHRAQGDISAALIPLQRALTLAEPEGYVRIFLDEGAPMANLLAEAAARGIMPAYTAMLLDHAGVEQPMRATVQAPLVSPAAVQPLVEPLVEPLSERELQVLRLFQSELSGPEIAAELVVALSTVRTHTKHIFGKLNVNSRRGAVKRAAELGLL